MSRATVVGKAVVEIEITEQQLSDMLCSAFEGGVNYWCSEVSPAVGENRNYTGHLSDAIARGDVTKIAVADSEGEDVHTITRDDLINAFGLLSKKVPHQFKYWLDDNSDASTADCWFQLAVFGEVIYG